MIVEAEILFDLRHRLRDLCHRGIGCDDLIEHVWGDVSYQRNDILATDPHARFYTTDA